MSKIGDLFVRLGLKKDEFSRGIKAAGNEAKGFSGIVKTLGSAARVAFSAVGAAVAGVIAVMKSLSDQNQVLADAFQRTAAGMQAMFDTLKTSLANLDFTNLLSDLREANRLAKDLYDAQDAMGEIGTSYNIAMAQQLKRIAELKRILRDVGATDEERLNAGHELLRIYEQLEKNPTRGLSRLKDTTIDYYMQRMGVNMDGRSDAEMKAMRERYVNFFKWLGTKEGEVFQDAAQRVAKSGGLGSNLGRAYTSNAAYKGMSEYARLTYEYVTKINDKKRERLEQAIVGYYKQDAKAAEDTLTIQRQIDSITARQDKGGGGGGSFGETILEKMERSLLSASDKIESTTERQLEDIVEDIDPIKFEPIEVIPPDMDGMMEAFDRFKAYAIDWDRLSEDFLENAVAGFSAGMQELTDQLFGLQDVNAGKIVQALLTPLADMAQKEGELLMLQGAGILAAKKGFNSMQPEAMIAAGAILVSAAAAVKSGLAAIAKAGSSSSSTSTYQGGSTSLGDQNIQTELTVTVKGELRGRDIVLAGQNTLNSWGR